MRNIEGSKKMFLCAPHDNIRLVKVFGMTLDIRLICKNAWWFEFIFIQIIFFPALDVIMVRNGINV